MKAAEKEVFDEMMESVIMPVGGDGDIHGLHHRVWFRVPERG